MNVEAPNGKSIPIVVTDTPGSSSSSSDNMSVAQSENLHRDHHRKQRFLPKHLLSPSSGRHHGLGRSASLSRLQIARQSASSLGEFSFLLPLLACRPDLLRSFAFPSSQLPPTRRLSSSFHLQRFVHPLSISSSISNPIRVRRIGIVRPSHPPSRSSLSRSRTLRSDTEGNETAQSALVDECCDVQEMGEVGAVSRCDSGSRGTRRDES